MALVKQPMDAWGHKVREKGDLSGFPTTTPSHPQNEVWQIFVGPTSSSKNRGREIRAEEPCLPRTSPYLLGVADLQTSYQVEVCRSRDPDLCEG